MKVEKTMSDEKFIDISLVFVIVWLVLVIVLASTDIAANFLGRCLYHKLNSNFDDQFYFKPVFVNFKILY